MAPEIQRVGENPVADEAFEESRVKSRVSNASAGVTSECGYSHRQKKSPVKPGGKGYGCFSVPSILMPEN
jgi:hypothetical protein